jgi:hypothetical protein
LPSLQSSAVPGLHAPLAQVSPLVHRLPSLQAPAFSPVCWQPSALSQLSVVHGLLSLQSSAPPPLQVPFLQVSATVQASPSSQAAVVVL